MGVDPGPLGRVLFNFASMNPLVVLENPLVRVCGMRYDIFVPTIIKSIGDVVPLVVFVSKGVKSKDGRLIEIFSAQNLDFSS